MLYYLPIYILFGFLFKMLRYICVNVSNKWVLKEVFCLVFFLGQFINPFFNGKELYTNCQLMGSLRSEPIKSHIIITTLCPILKPLSHSLSAGDRFVPFKWLFFVVWVFVRVVKFYWIKRSLSIMCLTLLFSFVHKIRTWSFKLVACWELWPRLLVESIDLSVIF